jgi:hypothetical protein
MTEPPPKPPGVPGSGPPVNAAKHLADFLVDNHGVLIASTEFGVACQSCGAGSTEDAADVVHHPSCVYEVYRRTT